MIDKNNTIKPKKFPTLYSVGENGGLHEWTISVRSNYITKRFGQVGKILHETKDIVYFSNSLGINKTTSLAMQAFSNASIQWDKKIKNGYTINKKEAIKKT